MRIATIIKILFLLDEKIVFLPGFVIVIHKLAATIDTLNQAAMELLYRILASITQNPIPKSNFLRTKDSMKKEKLKAQYRKSANSKFITKSVVDQLIF